MENEFSLRGRFRNGNQFDYKSVQKILMMMTTALVRKTKPLLRNPRRALRSKIAPLIHPRRSILLKRRAREIRIAREYLQFHGIWELLHPGEESEFQPQPFDLWNIYRLIRERRPRKVLEFGVGFSTLVIACALYRNHLDETRSKAHDANAIHGKVWSLDTSEAWIENTKAKLPDYLFDFVEFRQSPAKYACGRVSYVMHFVRFPT